MNHKNIAESIQKIADTGAQMERVLKQIDMGIVQSRMNMIENMITSVQSQIVNYPEKVNKALDIFQGITATFDSKYLEKIDILIKNLEEEDRKLVEVLKTTGWFLSPTIINSVPNAWINQALLDYESGDENAIFKLVRKSFKYKSDSILNESVERWGKNKYFKRRKHIIDQAVNAHTRGEYALSVTTFLSLIEGISGEFCKQNNIEVENWSHGNKKLTAALNDIDLDIHHPEIIQHIIEKFLFEDTRKPEYQKRVGKDFNSAFNRHAILHGLITDYDSEENSYKCLLFIDQLSVLKPIRK